MEAKNTISSSMINNANSNIDDNLSKILLMCSYYEKHLDQAYIGNSEKEKLFAMFIRDPRLGFGRRDLGRHLMRQADVSPEQIVKAGRYDDLLYSANANHLDFWKNKILQGDHLAKKWAPRLTGKDKIKAKKLVYLWGWTEKEYRRRIKNTETTEYKLSYEEKIPLNALQILFNEKGHTNPLAKTIDFSRLSYLTLNKYSSCFKTREDLAPIFNQVENSLKKRDQINSKKIITAYDIFCEKPCKSPDRLFDALKKPKINCIPVIDTSASMAFSGRDCYGKAISIGHYLAKCSDYCDNFTMSFSDQPRLMMIYGDTYQEQIKSIHTGDQTNLDLLQLMKVLEGVEGIEGFPEYLVVLTDQEFEHGSGYNISRMMSAWKKYGYKTKIVWWNFESDDRVNIKTDELGNIFIAGYSPYVIRFLECGFDKSIFLNTLLEEYLHKINA